MTFDRARMLSDGKFLTKKRTLSNLLKNVSIITFFVRFLLQNA